MFIMSVILKCDELVVAGEAEIVAKCRAERGECPAGGLAGGAVARLRHQGGELLAQGLEGCRSHGCNPPWLGCEKKDAPQLTFNQTQ
jgi:hypothetical protein